VQDAGIYVAWGEGDEKRWIGLRRGWIAQMMTQKCHADAVVQVDIYAHTHTNINQKQERKKEKRREAGSVGGGGLWERGCCCL
jgi:hypothetical protein